MDYNGWLTHAQLPTQHLQKSFGKVRQLFHYVLAGVVTQLAKLPDGTPAARVLRQTPQVIVGPVDLAVLLPRAAAVLGLWVDQLKSLIQGTELNPSCREGE